MPKTSKKVESKVTKWLTEEGLFMISCWARDGATIQEIADNVGVTPKTLHVWKRTYEEIREALSFSRELADYRVEAALYKRCIGFKVKEVKTVVSGNVDKNGNRPVRIETIEKEIIPDTTACLAWLNNRRPTQWKRNRDNVITPEESNMSNITINIVKGGKKDSQITAKFSSEEEEWEAEWNAADDEGWEDNEEV